MNQALIPIGPITTFNCDKCGKEKKNKFRNECPICHLNFDDICWLDHLDKEHSNDNRRYLGKMEVL